ELLAEEAALDDDVDAVARAGVGDEVDVVGEDGGDPVREFRSLADLDDGGAEVGDSAELEVDGDDVADGRVLDRADGGVGAVGGRAARAARAGLGGLAAGLEEPTLGLLALEGEGRAVAIAGEAHGGARAGEQAEVDGRAEG